MAAGFCTNCGYDLDTGSNFCARCGHEATRRDPAFVQSTQALVDVELASRWARLGARLLDGIIGAVPLIVILIILGGISSADDEDSSVIASVFLGLLSISWIIGYFVWQAILLSQRGQTLGKRIVGVRIVKTSTYQNGGFVTNILLREVVNSLIGIIPLYGLVDALFIFGSTRQTLHDRIADTVVIEA